MAGVKGRSGRRVRNLEDKIELVEGYSLAHAIQVYQGDDEKQKFALTKELVSKVLARRVKVGGDENAGPIRIVIRAPSNQAQPEAGQLHIRN